MDAVVWLPALVVGVVVSVLYRGWRYEEPLATDGPYARAREASRDQPAAEVVDDWTALDLPADEIRCQHCGARNETAFAFCEHCATRLPDCPRPNSAARPGD